MNSAPVPPDGAHCAASTCFSSVDAALLSKGRPMNVHVPEPGTYLAKLHAAHKERKKRIEARGVQFATQEENRAAFEKASAIMRKRAEIRKMEEQARQAAIKKELWRKSWQEMVKRADRRQRKLQASRISLERARAILAAEHERELNDEAPRVAFADILEAVAEKYGVSIIDMKSERRTRGPLMQARFECWWRARRETTLSLPGIGRLCGSRDHTTILHGIRTYDRMRECVATAKDLYANGYSNGGIIRHLVIMD